MFKVLLDLHLWFVPPMTESGPAVVMTRTLQLPFAPAKEIAIYSGEIDRGSPPLGFHLKDIIWDMDRQVFLAHTDIVDNDPPFPCILKDVRTWMDMGWRLGSYRDAYKMQPYRPPTERPRPSYMKCLTDDDEMETWPALPPRSRPKSFNRVFGVITRMLAETRNAEAVAYAMHRTKMFFTDEPLGPQKTAAQQSIEKSAEKNPAKERFRKARDEFYELPEKMQTRRLNRIMKAYPSLAQEVGS